MQTHQERYDQWAPDYNRDVAARNYDGPEYIVRYLMEIVNSGKVLINPTNPDFKVIDVGCGSGLVGKGLQEQGFRHIDGTDLSQGMIVEAHKTGAYQTLIGWVDLNHPLPFFLHGQYDLTLCCGVFALDFVEPQSLKWLAQVTKPGGTIIMSTKTTYYNTYDFEGYYKQLQSEGKIKLVDCRMDQPYLGTEADGHYWIFSVNGAS
ncbi:class I SAM-dependent methyltransferase [Moorena producens JHB]|uniref:Class I SAM-dependent methyltransferase n=1 Tax=Moorena producens (strain JHB) TaxID=1454205 RepID=A0A1D9FXA0_MOOP1|nr:class I SAM-dependent methyltransferase [Moorena producens]AOY80018.1 class I SAM-dependent methyltransferase [Moorena producens JHB]